MSLIVEQYENLRFGAGHFARRWWALPTQLLVGGSILTVEDFSHLQRDYGISAVLSVESEHEDPAPPQGVAHAWYPTADDWQKKPVYWWLQVLRFGADQLRSGARLYVHCQMGGSRSPAAAYGIMRATGAAQVDALAALRRVIPYYGDHAAHQAYLGSCEIALLAFFTCEGP